MQHSGRSAAVNQPNGEKILSLGGGVSKMFKQAESESAIVSLHTFISACIVKCYIPKTVKSWMNFKVYYMKVAILFFELDYHHPCERKLGYKKV